MLARASKGVGPMQRRTITAVARQTVAVVTGTVVLALGGSTAFAKPASTNANSGTSSAGASDGAEPGNWAEKKAGKLASEAIGADYWAGRYAMAEKKLREAIQICMVQHCANSFQARLHRDLGVVYIAGMKHIEEGKDEFTAALTADATVTLAASMEMPAVKQAFDEVKSSVTGGAQASSASAESSSAGSTSPNPTTEPEEVSKKDTHKSASSEGSPKESEPAAEVDEATPKSAEKRRMNWFSLGIQQDLVLHSHTSDACGSNSPYHCYDANNVRQKPYDLGSYVAGGNQVAAGGFQLGTLRVLAGYDRVIGRRFTVGLRVGSVILGKSPVLPGERAFMWFHGEARAAVWIGHEPFGTSLLQPYVFVSGGVAETDSKVLVQVQPINDSHLYSFDAWKRSGAGFIGGGVGLMAAITKRGGPNAELKYLQFLGPSVPSLAFQLGYSFGL